MNGQYFSETFTPTKFKGFEFEIDQDFEYIRMLSPNGTLFELPIEFDDNNDRNKNPFVEIGLYKLDLTELLW
jgi:hypothetical protein